MLVPYFLTRRILSVIKIVQVPYSVRTLFVSCQLQALPVPISTLFFHKIKIFHSVTGKAVEGAFTTFITVVGDWSSVELGYNLTPLAMLLPMPGD
jgi:hypothetical protein